MRRLDLDIVSKMFDEDVPGEDIVSYIRDSLDVGHIAFMLLRYPGVIPHSANYGYSTYPAEWIATYAKEHFYEIDPAVTLALSRGTAYDWSEAEFSERLGKLMQTAKSFGVAPQGFTIPLHGPRQELSILSVANKTVVTNEKLWEVERMTMVRDLIPIAQALQTKFLSDIGIVNEAGSQFILNDTQRQILHWTSQGKTTEEVAVILDKSTSTIKFYKALILKDLDCVNMTQAVQKAVSGGLVKHN